jgi:aminoglycoside/choline kinase family phosphotransferase/dTDP-glucose pyrophosphorylase
MKPGKSRITTAFILGAGLGTRLRPLTENCPKPLLPLGGRPIITYAMDHLISAGIERFIVNTHHCPECYSQAFPQRKWRNRPIIFRHEPVLLETAGGLKNIEDLLGQDDAIVCYNGDVFADFPLQALLDSHDHGICEATLVLRSTGPILNVTIDEAGNICDMRDVLGNPGIHHCLFTGIYIVETSILQYIEPGRIESIVPVFLRRISHAPGLIKGIVIDEGNWNDIGSINVYQDLTRRMAGTNYDRQGVIMTDQNKLIAFARMSLDIEDQETLSIEGLGGRGSDRAYYRVSYGDNQSVILCQYDPIRVENGYFVDIADFFHHIGVPTPLVIDHDPDGHLILMEDLGEVDLYSLKNESWKKRKSLYEAALKHISRLHHVDIHSLPSDLVLVEGFGPDLYKWEREYFLTHFVKGVCHLDIPLALANELDEELNGLAESLMEPPLSLVHRDFQSQNIMVSDRDVYFIDFQGMRIGSPFYDLGSLLFDPYVHFTDEQRNDLLSYYFESMNFGLLWPAFLERFYRASAQRLMQALGAYGFLGVTKGLTDYLTHIPAGLENLSFVAEKCPFLPSLKTVCDICRSATPKE